MTPARMYQQQLCCNAMPTSKQATVGFYRAKGFKQSSAVAGEKGNNNCWDMLPEALQSCFQKGNKYMFIGEDSYPMDLMTLHPSSETGIFKFAAQNRIF